MEYATGFDILESELSNDFERLIFGQIRAAAVEVGAECVEVVVGGGTDLAVTLDYNGFSGMVVYLRHQWGYSLDKKNMIQVATPEMAINTLIEYHIENGGLIGIAA